MRIERLAWAGIKVVVGDTVAVVDALGGASSLVERYMGPPRHEIRPVAGSVDVALVTHVHPDHYDPATLRSCLEADALVLCPMTMEQQVKADDLRPALFGPGDSLTVGGITVTAVRAVDGLGVEQVSWVVSAGGRSILHAGDTLWHGYWWQIADDHGPFEVAFLPINGALVEFPTPTGVPACLTPEQAVAAGRVLGAGTVCPIHYGTFDFPPRYAEYPDAERTFLEAAARQGLETRVLEQGDRLDL